MCVKFGHPKAGEQVWEEVIQHEPRRPVNDAYFLARLHHVAQRERLPLHHVERCPVVLPAVKHHIAVVLHIVDAGHQQRERVVSRVPLNPELKGDLNGLATLPLPGVQSGLAGAVSADHVLVLPVLDVVGQDQMLAGVLDAQEHLQLKRVAVLHPSLIGQKAASAPVGRDNFNGACAH